MTEESYFRLDHQGRLLWEGASNWNREGKEELIMKKPGHSPKQREQRLPRPLDGEKGSVWLEPVE